MLFTLEKGSTARCCRFREVGAASDYTQLPDTSPSVDRSDDTFESAEVSGILGSNPIHALGLRLLGRRSSRLEFVTIDEAREATGASYL